MKSKTDVLWLMLLSANLFNLATYQVKFSAFFNGLTSGLAIGFFVCWLVCSIHDYRERNRSFSSPVEALRYLVECDRKTKRKGVSR